MKKALLIGLLISSFSLALFSSSFVFANGFRIVPECPQGYCTKIEYLFGNPQTGEKGVIQNVMDFILNWIVVPLAVFFLVIGGIVLLTSAGKPEMQSLGKKIIFAAIIGMFLAFGAKAIINFVLKALGAIPGKVPPVQ